MSHREEWRPVPGSDGFYEVSNLGRVRSWKKKGPGGERKRAPHLLAQNLNNNGYPETCLFIDGQKRTCRVHVLVALAFLGPRPIGMQVAHGDGDRRNGALENLRYATPAENSHDSLLHGTVSRGEHRYNARLTDVAVRDAKARNAAGESTRELAQSFGVSKTAIKNAINGTTWKHVQTAPSGAVA